MKSIIVLGASGHARVVCDMIIQQGKYNLCGLIAPAGTGFWDLPVLGTDDALSALFERGVGQAAFVAVGANQLRERLFHQLECIGYELPNIIHKNAELSSKAVFGRGICISAGVIVNAGAQIGNGCILNTNCSIDHDDVINDFCHVAPGSTLCGNVKVGSVSFLGAGCRVIDGIHIGSRVTVGAGATVIRDLPDNCTAVGVPAQIIK